MKNRRIRPRSASACARGSWSTARCNAAAPCCASRRGSSMRAQQRRFGRSGTTDRSRTCLRCRTTSPRRSRLRLMTVFPACERRKQPPPPTRDIEAYLAWLRGRTLTGRYTAAKADAAAAEFEQAIARDPGFAAAYAALYDARMQSAALRFEDTEAARRRNRPLLERALALAPHSGRRVVRTGDVGRPRRRHARSDLPRGRAP